MTYPAPEYLVPPMTVDAASNYASDIHSFVSEEASKTGLPGDEALDFAYDRFERSYGVGRWTVEHLRKRKAKSCDVGIYARLRAAYLDLCERQVSKLQSKIALERAKGDDTNQDLADRLRAIAAEIEASKAGQRLARATAADEVAE
jgi:predicted RNA-binding Zn ribbon-like protein